LASRGSRRPTRSINGGGKTFEFGRVKFVNAIHSSQLPDGSYGGNPGGFLVQDAQEAFYYSGDTALTHDMHFVAQEANLRFAVLPIGDNFTMGAHDAAKAAGLLKCRRVVGVHYDTFPPIEIDHAEADSIFARAGVKLELVPIGGSVDL
jgi:L-ascorbate metabolism protein UlaG (beta-lactamase superfamily)